MEKAKACIEKIDSEAIQHASQGAYIIYGWALGILMQLGASGEDDAPHEHEWVNVKAVNAILSLAS